MQMTALGLAACLAAGLTGACWAQDLKATQRLSGTQIDRSRRELQQLHAHRDGPERFHGERILQGREPRVDLRRFGAHDDGIYNYHLTASSDEKVTVRSALDNGRDGGPTTSRLKAVSASGQFIVKGGTIVKPDATAREK